MKLRQKSETLSLPWQPLEVPSQVHAHEPKAFWIAEVIPDES